MQNRLLEAHPFPADTRSDTSLIAKTALTTKRYLKIATKIVKKAPKFQFRCGIRYFNHASLLDVSLLAQNYGMKRFLHVFLKENSNFLRISILKRHTSDKISNRVAQLCYHKNARFITSCAMK